MNAKKGIIYANFVKPETLGSLATTTIAYAILQGITLDEIAQSIDISELDYANQDARLPDPVIGELMNVLVDKLPDRAISMEIAHCAPFSMLGGLVQGAMFATDFESALTWFVENSSIIADQSVVHLEKTDSEVALVVAHPSESLDQGHTLEATAGLIWRLLNTITVPGAPLQKVEFANPKAVPLQPYEEFFQAPVWFHTGRNALVFSIDILRLPIHSANAQMFDFIKQHFANLRQKLNEDRYPAALIPLRRSIMDNAAHGKYEVAAAAAAANLSLRTAQRLAKQHGTSLQKLIDEIRLINAKKFLSNPEINIATVAQLLGYADVRAFRKAFKRWTALTPNEYRKERLKE
ncbi:family transcriptional regulator [Leptolyngbya sp. Heron Island J]|uniref:AraC family transcriptional regulator n=1 Tax=Leptolyngbya sp. Heron Island J TaxID=1385935 RepID=UPI0003B9C868|nr:AraC family transcriptional regulator [Leptolyngbya sp. Heron Island J]ESA39115.1 family transcriptional regulator [Leptolyngbya sp. Heron Island J]